MAANQDPEIFDSWEDIEDTSVLDRKLAEYLPLKATKQTEFQRSGPMILIGDDALRSQYVPPEPTVKILKRPNGVEQMTNGNDKPRPQPMKTLRQREQEYAEARLRILGEAKSPDEDSSETEYVRTLVKPSSDVFVIRSPRGPDGTKGFKVRR